MYPGIVYIDQDSVHPTAADIKALAAHGHDIILLSDQTGTEGEIRRGLAGHSTFTYTVITKPGGSPEEWKAVSIHTTARLLNAVKLFLIGDIEAPESRYYTTEHYKSIAQAIGGIR
jgi:hypothetical protein